MAIPFYNGRSGEDWYGIGFSRTSRKIYSNAPTPGTYIIWANNGGIPSVEHCERGVALKEAERLALLHPGTVFTVLYVSAASYIVPQPKVTTITANTKV